MPNDPAQPGLRRGAQPAGGRPWWASPQWAIALTLAAGAALWWPAWHDARDLRNRIEQAKTQLQTASRTAAEMAELTAAMAAIDEELASGGKTVPERGQLADLLRELGTRIETTGLEDSTIAGRPVEPGEHFSTMPVEVAFRGRSLDALEFIRGIERMERLMQVTRLRLVADRPGRVEATVRLQTFFHGTEEGER